MAKRNSDQQNRPNGGRQPAEMVSAVPNPPRSWRGMSCIYLLLVALVAGAFLPVLGSGFVEFDDNLYVSANPQVRGGLSWTGVKWALGSVVAENWHPVTMLSHMLDVQVFGLRAWGHHLTSLLIHAANTVLCFAILRRLTGRVGPALFAAALFGVHPLRVESVAWIAERKDVLSGFFFMLTLWAYSSYVQSLKSKVQSPNTQASWSYGAALAAFVLGLMSKPMLVTLPFVLLLLDYWPLTRFEATTLNAKLSTLGRLLMEKLPFLALAAAASAVTFLVQKQGGALVATGRLPFAARCENALVSYCRYLGKLFWPVDLSALYPHPGHWPAMLVAAAGLVLAVISVCAVYWRQKAPYLLVGWLWFIGMLIPVSGLVQVGRQSLADRYTYLPLIGLFLVLAWGAAATGARFKTVWTVVGALAVLVCAGLTWRQARYWKDDGTLFAHAVAVTERNYVAYLHLGDYWQSQGRPAEALRAFESAVKWGPGDPEARDALGTALLAQGHAGEAARQFTEALKLQPEMAEAHKHLAMSLAQQGQTEEAIKHFQACVRLAADDAEAHAMLARSCCGAARPRRACSIWKLPGDCGPTRPRRSAISVSRCCSRAGWTKRCDIWNTWCR